MIKLTSDNENVQKFLDYVHSQLRKNKFKLVLHMDNLKIGKNNVSGYFSEDSKEIVISIKEENWLEILVHEFNHFVQFINNEEKYVLINQGESNFLNELWEWLDGNIELNTKRKNLLFKTVQDMELDCERKSVEMIKSFDLPIDIEEYSSIAHIYIFYYTYAKKNRCWFSENSTIKDIMTEGNFKNLSLDCDFTKLPETYVKLFKNASRKFLDK